MRSQLLVLTALLFSVAIAGHPTSAGTATTTSASTTATTRSDPLASPESAVRRVFSLLKERQFTEIRPMCLEQPTLQDVREQCAPALAMLAHGYVPDIEAVYMKGNVASVICVASKEGAPPIRFPMIVVQRFDDWKVELENPNPRRLTPDERGRLVEVYAQTKKRLVELDAATQPTTQPAH